jgi:hypothetical protein
MLRIMAAGLVAVAVGTVGGLILCPQASGEAVYSTVTFDLTTTSAPQVPSFAPVAIERTRTAPLPISTEVSVPVQEVTSADEKPKHAAGNKRRNRLTARSAPPGVVHHRRGYGSADDDCDDD